VRITEEAFALAPWTIALIVIGSIATVAVTMTTIIVLARRSYRSS
jgi:hypothetical protein